MTLVDAALLYLLVFRLAIIAVAILGIVLGYKLFCRGIGTAIGSGTGSTIESSVIGVRLTVRNAAPGTAFALFGAVLLVVMIVQSRPSVTFETLSKMQAKTGAEESGLNVQTEKLLIRGNEQNSISLLTAKGVEYERQGDAANAERAYKEAVSIMAEPMNDLAWSYIASGRLKDAVGLATIAVRLRPDETRYQDTLNKASAATK